MTGLSDELRLLADGLSVGVIRLDRELVVRYANPAVHVFAGRPSGSLFCICQRPMNHASRQRSRFWRINS